MSSLLKLLAYYVEVKLLFKVRAAKDPATSTVVYAAELYVFLLKQ